MRHTIEIIIAILLLYVLNAKGQNVGNLYVVVDSGSAFAMKDSVVTLGASTYQFGVPLKTRIKGLWVTPSINTAYFNSFFVLMGGGSWVILPSPTDSLPLSNKFVPLK